LYYRDINRMDMFFPRRLDHIILRRVSIPFFPVLFSFSFFRVFILKYIETIINAITTNDNYDVVIRTVLVITFHLYLLFIFTFSDFRSGDFLHFSFFQLTLFIIHIFITRRVHIHIERYYSVPMT